jgi:1-acyl-sn-glycerol-3-phosphate acyltransferase
VKTTLRFWVARSILRALISVVIRVRVDGLEGLPRKQPYILACNHLSWIDPFLLISYLPITPRLHFLGKRSAIYNRAIKRWTLRFMGGVIPVESGDVERLCAAVMEVFQRGGVTVIFPEGGIGVTEGRLQSLRPGVAHFSIQSLAPVVTAGIAGTSELWRGKEVRLHVGRTVWPDRSWSVDVCLSTIRTALVEALPPDQQPAVGPRPWTWLTHLLR